VRFLGLLTLLALAFWAGYYFGEKGETPFQKRFYDLRGELTSKTESLQEEVSAARVRMNLLSARDHLIEAEKELVDKNFGEAEKELSQAEERLGKATTLAKKAGRQPLLQRLTPITASLRETRTDVRRLNPQAKGRVASLAKELDQMID
jgi:chromosome segregation ATPase